MSDNRTYKVGSNNHYEILNYFDSNNCNTECINTSDDKIKTIRITPKKIRQDLWDFLNELKGSMLKFLVNELKNRRNLKYFICVHVKFLRHIYSETPVETVYTEGYRNSTCKSVYLGQSHLEIEEDLLISFEELVALLRDFEHTNSGWIIEEIHKIDLSLATYKPLKGSNSTFIKLPNKIKNKRACINIDNADLECFKWSILAAIRPSNTNKQKVSSYKKYEHEFNFTGIKFPTPITDCNKFESLNSEVSLNVFGLDENNDAYPLKISNYRNRRYNVDLLYVTSENEEFGHYVTILNLNRFLHSFQSKGHNPLYFCRYCCHGFIRPELLNSHIAYCQNFGTQKTELPKEPNNILKYSDLSKEEKAPFVMFADFESILMPYHTCQPDPSKSFTHKTHKHVPISYCYVIIDSKDELYKLKSYIGLDCASHFIDEITKEADDLLNQVRLYDKLELNALSKSILETTAKSCYICNKNFDAGDVRCFDHCHITGEFRGVCHNSCNLSKRHQKNISCFIHNTSRYDNHLIMLGLNKNHNNLHVIAENLETFISFKVGSVIFKDSLRILGASLSTLTDNLANINTANFKCLIKHFGLQKASFLTRKGVFPYSYITEENLNESKLPSKEAFYDSLKEEGISDDDYDWALQVYSEFKLQNIGEYLLLYNESDVLQLCDVFIYFRNLCFNQSGLDIAHFLTIASYSWNACLKHTSIELELITDIDMYNFLELGMRGGISSVFKRLATANNPQVENYDPSLPNSYCLYVDVNNLYGYCLSKPLPTSSFRFLSKSEIDSLDITKHPDDSTVGYILDVEIYTPDELHDYFSDLCPISDRIHITPDMLSDYTKYLYAKIQTKIPLKSTKLTSTLLKRKQYVVYYVNLKYLLNLGLKVSKVHRVLSFHQTPWVKSYIEMNTQRRKASKNDFEKSFYKALNNVIWGKSCQSRRKERQIVLKFSSNIDKTIAKPNVKSWKVYDKDLIAIELQPQKVLLNTPIYTGLITLDRSKQVLQQYHEMFKIAYRPNIDLLFCDTDSLCYLIKTEDMYKDLKTKWNEIFDFSNYPKDHPLYDDSNKAKPGLLKDETAGKAIRQFVGLKPKMYSILLSNYSIRKGKGVGRRTLQKYITHDQYLKCLTEEKVQCDTMKSFRTFKHEINSATINKLSLNPLDDKRFYLNSIDSIPYGHYMTRKKMRMSNTPLKESTSIKTQL